MAVLSRVLRLRAAGLDRFVVRSFQSSSSSWRNSEIDPKAAAVLPLQRDVKDRNVQWVFLGCPGVGKGTYASKLSTLLGVPHIATGDLVRDELSSKGPLAHQLEEVVNQGKLVSDEIIIDLLSKRLEDSAAKGETGFILDGFPRTIRQAEILEGVTEIDLVINLKLREEALLAKCLGRRICSECGGNYNVATIDIKAEEGNPSMYMAPLLPPSHCASKLISRSDDTEEVVKRRLHIYNEKSQPVEEFYRSRGKLLEFDLPGGIPESWPKLLRALNLEDHDDKQSAAA
ncbi:PREDICTED: probable adenylate kinase 6, chloroplastic [Fragaria vesca subsp. vesca]|uniref:probable adenylate kinase 6, chloroplastic n=1 Tax=Fragaria vesca subsp. vesca TaxID=101020 RepID=UPI0002C33337|nr:PREDICTED: probable adenylate kinase 6, chloroplastic [Fragaria vesca subsp. vesca]